MQQPIFDIDGEVIPIERIWVHMSGPNKKHAQRFTLYIPGDLVSRILDPHGGCPEDVSLELYIWQLLSEMGTFIFEGYLKNMRQLQGRTRGSPLWIISNVEQVRDLSSQFVISGDAIPFDESRWCGDFVEIQ